VNLDRYESRAATEQQLSAAVQQLFSLLGCLCFEVAVGWVGLSCSELIELVVGGGGPWSSCVERRRLWQRRLVDLHLRVRLGNVVGAVVSSLWGGASVALLGRSNHGRLAHLHPSCVVHWLLRCTTAKVADGNERHEELDESKASNDDGNDGFLQIIFVQVRGCPIVNINSPVHFQGAENDYSRGEHKRAEESE